MHIFLERKDAQETTMVYPFHISLDPNDAADADAAAAAAADAADDDDNKLSTNPF